MDLDQISSLYRNKPVEFNIVTPWELVKIHLIALHCRQQAKWPTMDAFRKWKLITVKPSIDGFPECEQLCKVCKRVIFPLLWESLIGFGCDNSKLTSNY